MPEALTTSIPPTFDLERFVRIQDQVIVTGPLDNRRHTEYEQAFHELHAGRTSNTHWVSFMLPRVFGIGQSRQSRFYGLKSAQEASRYLAHPILGPRLRQVGQVLNDEVRDLAHLMEMVRRNRFVVAKVKACVTLFATVGLGQDGVFFTTLLERFWAGTACEATLEILNGWAATTTTSSLQDVGKTA